MIKIILAYVCLMSGFLVATNGNDLESETPLHLHYKEGVNIWLQKLNRDSVLLAVAIRFNEEGGNGSEEDQKAYNDYLYTLAQNVQYDRFIIRELKKK